MHRAMKKVQKFELYLDLDGVFADFVRGCKEMLGRTPEEFAMAKQKKEMWRGISYTKNFYHELKPMPGADRLWKYCQKYKPTIISGTPNFEHAPIGKRAWVRQHLGPKVSVICCHSHDKAKLRSKPGAILLDDNEALTRKSWEEMGGIFVHHVDADSSIAKLRAILEPGVDDNQEMENEEDPEDPEDPEDQKKWGDEEVEDEQK